MTMRIAGTALVALLASAGVGFGRQKGQCILGTNGLNAGIQPAPGFAYSNQATFFWADRLKGGNSQPIPVDGSFDLRIDWKLIAHGSVVAGISDTYVQPFILGYHFPRVAPTGRFRPLLNATNNIGSGYWGYLPSISSTIYLTKNKGTTLSVFSAYEFRGKKRHTNITPGQFGVVGPQASFIKLECEFLLPVRAGIRRPCGKDHVDLRLRRQFSCCEMMSPPKSRYCNSATVPPANPTAMGS